MDRESLARTFDRAADTYQQARPDYPDELWALVETLTGVIPGASVLEVGCATGKATLPLARAGYRVTALEPGPRLATAARQNLAEFGAVQVIETTFEHWVAPSEAFALVVAATAWRWVDPEVRYHKAAEVLRPGGHLAFWTAEHVFPDGGDRFFREIQPVYDEIGEGLPPDAPWLRPDELPDEVADIEASGRFAVIDVRRLDWEVTYDADGYLGLLDTFSGHIAMAPWQRDRLYGEIRRRLDARPDGRLRRHWGTVLHVARRR